MLNSTDGYYVSNKSLEIIENKVGEYKDWFFKKHRIEFSFMELKSLLVILFIILVII